mmetsp:Transcript_21975/g.41648  ORF Transcript_21975/g.41648 Transcript_21975/m.41648 type:complete len:101 (-) Transcript_21975:69-371(-)
MQCKIPEGYVLGRSKDPLRKGTTMVAVTATMAHRPCLSSASRKREKLTSSAIFKGSKKNGLLAVPKKSDRVGLHPSSSDTLGGRNAAQEAGNQTNKKVVT